MCNCYFQYCQNFFTKNPLNGGVYIDILNKTNTPISFIIQYTVDIRTFTKQSPVFGLDKSERIQISHSAVNICFNVLNNSTNPPGFICNVVLLQRKRHCYQLIQTESNFQLIEISC